MTTSAQRAPHAVVVADLDRRLHAFVVDRLLGWSLAAGAGAGAWLGGLGAWATAGAALGTLLLVGLVLAVVLGTRGTSPGMALVGLRVVDVATGTPIGVARALLRQTVLGLATLPLLGLGTATLAWTAAADPTRARRGWHDHRTRSVVVDVRPRAVAEGVADERPRQIVNLTAMRLVPADVSPAPTAAPAPRPAQPAREPAQPPREPAPVPPAPVPPAPAPPAPVAPGRHAAGPPPPAAPAPPGPATVVSGTREAAVLGAGEPAPRRRRTTWRLAVDSGETLEVTGVVLVGRNPEPRAGEQVSALVPLRSADMSISKTHAQFHVAPDGALVVTDRGSTNGSVLVRQGMSRELSAGRPATLLDGDRVGVGDREIVVVREAG